MIWLTQLLSTSWSHWRKATDVWAATWENIPSDVHATKTQISLHIHAVWSESLMFVVCMKKLCILSYPKCIQGRVWPYCVNTQTNLNLHAAIIWRYSFWRCDHLSVCTHTLCHCKSFSIKTMRTRLAQGLGSLSNSVMPSSIFSNFLKQYFSACH